VPRWMSEIKRAR